MTDTVDPVRDRVEATLRRAFDVATAGPCGIFRTAQRTAAQTADFARTVINLTVDGLLGWDVDAGVPPRLGATAPVTAIDTGGSMGDDADTSRAAAGAAADLAIAGYEDLPASHIVARLERLGEDELIEVRRFELAHRGRRTVVGKIDQLLAQR
jgi:hypothetical protein